jgi:tetratricopeptide (TPR) repeat protein
VLRKPVRFLLIVCLTSLFSNPAQSTAQVKAESQASPVNEILDRINREADLEHISDASFEQLGTIIARDPHNARAHLLLGRGYESLGLPEQAYDQFRTALQYGLDKPQEVVQLIKALAKSGHMTSAQNLVDEAVKRFPDDPEIMFWEGNFLYSRNQVPQAEEKYAQALRRHKTIIGLYSALASIRYGQKRYDMALALAQKDLALDPKMLLSNEVAGLSLLQLKRYAEAAGPLGRAFMGSPIKNLISEGYARALYWTGDYKDALRPALVNLAFTSDLYSYNIGSKRLLEPILRHVRKADIAEKIEEVNRHLGINRNAAFHFCLADVLDRHGYIDLAIDQYQQGLKIEPKFGKAWFRLGLDLETYKHDYAGALTCLRKAAAFAPQDESIAKYLLRLEDRWPTYKNDWAWQMRDWLTSTFLH